MNFRCSCSSFADRFVSWRLRISITLTSVFATSVLGGNDFLVVIVEDVSANRFGSEVRPNPTEELERVAREATVFTQAYCPASVCNASRTALLTSHPPEWTGIFGNQDRSDHLPTVLDYLLDEGYQLHAVGKIFHNGFERNSIFTRYADPQPSRAVRVELEKRGIDDRLRIGVRRGGAAFGDAALKADRISEWIRRADSRDRNGFLVGFTATHLPYFVPDSPRYAEAYDPSEIRLPTETWPRPEFMGRPNPKFRLSTRDRKWVISRYLGCLRYASDEAARVIRTFRSRFPEGHVVFLSDHGFLLGEGRSWGKSNTMEAACRVPYFVWSPRLPAREVTGPVSTGTTFPLLLDLCGVKPFPEAVYESPRRRVRKGYLKLNASVSTYAGNSGWWRVSRGSGVVHHRHGKKFFTGFDDKPAF